MMKVVVLLLPYFGVYKARMLIALACLIMAKVAGVAAPLLMKQLIDGLDSHELLQLAPAMLVVAYGFLRLSTIVFNEFRELIFVRVVQRSLRLIANNMFSHLHALGPRFYLYRQPGIVARDLDRGQRSIMALVSMAFFTALPTLIEIALIFSILIIGYSWFFTAIAVLALTLYSICTASMTKFRQKIRRTLIDTDNIANGIALDSLQHHDSVVFFCNEKLESSRYDLGMAKWEKAGVRFQQSNSLLNLGQAAIITSALTFSLYHATTATQVGVMTIGDLVLINALMLQLFSPLSLLGAVYRDVTQTMVDLERMFLLLDERPEVSDFSGALDLAQKGGGVAFENVAFSYDGGKEVLQSFSLTVPAGSTVAIVGLSGAGKSTLARLLFRLYDPDQGRIVIDGQDIKMVTVESLRAVLGIVPQDSQLFNETIRYNISYGRPGSPLEDIQAVAQQAGIHDFIMSLPEGYETRVGERGVKLSGGERQRIAIARVLLKNPKIIIFDEATSALDTISEVAIEDVLLANSRGRTTLIIAHRLSTVVKADKIVVLNKGGVEEQGTHRELIDRGGIYSEMWHQFERDRSTPMPLTSGLVRL
ncbi:ABCB family ABC transporter ATP-binding protein/permease [Pseudomonas nicosulfuronedens]